MEFQFSGINIYSKQPEVFLSFIKSSAFGFWRKYLQKTNGMVPHWLCKIVPKNR